MAGLAHDADRPALSIRWNRDLDFTWLAQAVQSRAEMTLVWPGAAYPLDESVWRDHFLSFPDNRSLFIESEGETIGHAGMMAAREPARRHLSYLFLAPHWRGRGLGRAVLARLEDYARDDCGAAVLTLKTNTFNPRALHLYGSSEYREVWRDGDTVFMHKSLT